MSGFSMPFQFQSVSGPQLNSVIAVVVNALSSLHVKVHLWLPDAFRQAFFPFLGSGSFGHSAKSIKKT